MMIISNKNMLFNINIMHNNDLSNLNSNNHLDIILTMVVG